MIKVASIRPNRISTDCARRRGMLRSAMRRRMRLMAAKPRRPRRMKPTAPAIHSATVSGGTPKKLVNSSQPLLLPTQRGGGGEAGGGDGRLGVRGDLPVAHPDQPLRERADLLRVRHPDECLIV